MGYNYSVFASIVPGVLEYYVALSEHEESQTDCWVTCFWGDAAHSTYDDPISGWKTPIAGNKDSFTVRRFKIIDEVINTAITRGKMNLMQDSTIQLRLSEMKILKPKLILIIILEEAIPVM